MGFVIYLIKVVGSFRKVREKGNVREEGVLLLVMSLKIGVSNQNVQELQVHLHEKKQTGERESCNTKSLNRHNKIYRYHTGFIIR